MSRTIRVDDEVFEALQKLSEPLVDTPNSTLRRLLGLCSASASSSHQADDQAEKGFPQHELLPYLSDGRLRARQRLVWRRRNLKQVHHAVVLSNGNLRVGDKVFGTPSRAASVIAGHPQNGLTAWRAEDGIRLKDL